MHVFSEAVCPEILTFIWMGYHCLYYLNGVRGQLGLMDILEDE